MADLSNLSIEDLRRLQAEAQAQIELKERKPGRSRTLQDWHSAISTVLQAEEGLSIPPYPVWQRQQSAKTLRGHVATAEKVAKTLFKEPKPRRNQLIDAREFLVSMVLAYIRNALGLPVTINATCANIGNCGAAVDASFPGYRRCGVPWMGFEMWVKARAAGVWNP